MSRKCAIDPAKGVLYGNQVSHSNRKSSKRFVPNLQNISLRSEILKKSFTLRISLHTLRSIEHNNGLDGYLTSKSNTKLTAEAVRIKKAIIAASPVEHPSAVSESVVQA